MKISIFKLLTLLLCSQAFAVEPPKTYNANRYYHLWKKSIVTDKPDPVVKEPEKNDLEDWVLVGSKKTARGQSITILNTKDQTQRIQIPSKGASELGFAILELKQDRGNFTRTKAFVQKGGFSGWVSYDQKFLALRGAAKPAKGARRKPNNRKTAAKKGGPPIPGLQNQSGKNNTNKKRRRVRYVPKPKK